MDMNAPWSNRYQYQPTENAGLDESSLADHVKRARSNSVETIGPASQAAQPKSKRARIEGIELGCPFCKYRPGLWAGIKDCGLWSNIRINTVIRHHVLNKHKKINDSLDVTDPRYILPQRFTDLDKWYHSTRIEQKKAIEHWSDAYIILFDIDKSRRDRVPHPGFQRAPALNQLEDRLRQRRLDGVNVEDESRDLTSGKELLVLRRELAKGYVREYFGHQICKVERARDIELRRIDERYIAEFEKLKDQVTSDLTSVGPQPSQTILQQAGSALSQNVGADFGWSGSGLLDLEFRLDMRAI